MDFIITVIILLLILGIIVFIHELGHFIAAKKSGVNVSEFAIGMGPEIFTKKGKDNTKYSVRAFPVGGFVAMAYTNEENKKLKKEEILENKTYLQKFIILMAGVFMNFVLAIIILFASGLIFGSPIMDPVIGNVQKNSPAAEAGLEKGDKLLSVDGKKINSWDDVTLVLSEKKIKKSYTFKVKRDSCNCTQDIEIFPIKKKIKKQERYIFGISSSEKKEYGFKAAIKYTGKKFVSMIDTMGAILGKIFTGKIGADKLSGPLGMFSVVDDMKSSGMENILFLIAFLSVNVGVINLIPIPVFDGGRLLLTTIEQIKRSKINPNIEGYLNLIGFALLILLMVYVTINDIIKLF